MAIAMNNHVFKGHRTLLGNKFVTYGELELPTRDTLYTKSKSGFDWGNGGSGAHQLAFAMLYQLTNDFELSSKYAEAFVHAFVRKFNSRDWIISAADVIKWIEQNCEQPKQPEQTQNIKSTPKKTVSQPKKRKTNVVKEVCKELGITQKQLAEILEVPEGTVSSWAVKDEIPRLGKKAIEFYIANQKNQQIVDSYKNFIELLQSA